MLVPKRIVKKEVRIMQTQSGFTLLEVMIAAFILAVGMLGSTAVMLRGIQQADNTNYQGLAAQSAMNMAERMRVNLAGQGKSGTAYDDFSADKDTVKACTTTCTSADVALYHAYVWGQELDDLLPNTAVTGKVIAINPNVDDSVYKITVTWVTDKRIDTENVSNTTNSYVMIFQP